MSNEGNLTWTKIGVEEPDVGEKVLVVSAGGTYYLAQWTGTWFRIWNNHYELRHYDYWCRLPKPPRTRTPKLM